MLGMSFRSALLLLLASACAAQSLDGVWRTRGYGLVFEVHGSSLKAYEVTSTTCLPGFTATRSDSAGPGREAVFTTIGGGVFLVRAGGTADHKLLHGDGSASDMRIDRIAKMPAACDPPTANDPQDNFEVFSRTWAENYISFDLKKTDWSKVVEANRAKVTAQTTPEQLFDIFESMIQPFGDAHTSIRASELKRTFHGFRPGAAEPDQKELPGIFAVTDRAYLHGPLQKFCNDRIQYGHIDDGTGYLRITAFAGYAKSGGFAGGLEALEAALDTIFSDTALKALVIDVRINFGGADPYGLAIASRLATREYLAYTKEARDGNGWTPGDPSVVRPSTRPGFRGPVVELTGPVTISAGETFTQALMARTPHVTRIGENTQGVFSDVLGRGLPNGWSFGLPNEVFRTPDGKTFDGPGIPPDVAVPVFARQDLDAGKDPGLARALQVLAKH